MLLETVGQMQEKEELSGAVRENLEKKLLWAGVEAKRIYMTENKNGARQLIMALSAKSARCISMKLVCERIEGGSWQTHGAVCKSAASCIISDALGSF